MIEATPKGADIQTAANAFLGMLDAESNPPKKEQTPASDAPVEANEPLQDAPQESETVEEPIDNKAVEGDEPSADTQYTLPERFEDLANDFGVEPEKLLNLKVKTKIDGEEGEARLADLIKSYQLEGHLNRRNMEIVERQKAFEQEVQTHKAYLAQQIQTANQYTAMLEHELAGEYSKVNWDELRTTDPAEFAAKRQEFADKQTRIQQTKVQLDRQLQTEIQQAQYQQNMSLQQFKAQQAQELLSKIPEWKDPAKYQSDAAELKTYLLSQGYAPEQIDNINRASDVTILRKAYLWDKLQGSKAQVTKKVVNAPKVIRPGASKDKAALDSDRRNAQLMRLRKSGRVEDAASIFLDFV